MTADTTPAAEALARALLANEFEVVEDEAENARRAAAALLAHPFTDSERAALVAALLDGHEGVLAGAMASTGHVGPAHRKTLGITPSEHDHDCLLMPPVTEDAAAIVAALAGKEPTA